MPLRKPENASWFFALIVILVVFLVVWAVLSLRIDLFTEAIEEGAVISILIVIDDGERLLVSEVFYYHPVTQNAALTAIPIETGTLLSAVDRIGRLESIYDASDLEAYRNAVETLLGYPISFAICLDSGNFERLVDHLGGIDVFIPNEIDDIINGVRYLFPPGSVKLDGAKALSYVEYRPKRELIAERMKREHRVIQSLLRSIGYSGDRLVSSEVFPYIRDLFDSNLDDRSLSTIIKTLAAVDSERLVLQGIIGNQRTLEGEIILFPFYDGNLIKETVQSINKSLAKADVLGDEELPVRVEILNGTSLSGLAFRTAQLYKSFGFRIAAIANADLSNYSRTIVLDRKGNPEAAKQVAELIRCEQVHSQIDENRDETVDVTVILGKDFDGRYVKE